LCCFKIFNRLKYADAFIDRGAAYADLKQFEKAIQDYNQAIELKRKKAS
jgi:Flp pilus assembly protein TadD